MVIVMGRMIFHDESEWSDSDGDGVGDNSDAFPNPYGFQDSDKDGVPSFRY